MSPNAHTSNQIWSNQITTHNSVGSLIINNIITGQNS